MYQMTTALAGALAAGGLLAVSLQHQGVAEARGQLEGASDVPGIVQASREAAAEPAAGAASSELSRRVAHALRTREYSGDADLNADGFVNVLDLARAFGDPSTDVPAGDGSPVLTLDVEAASVGRHATLSLRVEQQRGFQPISYSLVGSVVNATSAGAAPRVLSVEPRIDPSSAGQVLRSLGPNWFMATHRGVAADPQPLSVEAVLDIVGVDSGRYEIILGEESVALDAEGNTASFAAPRVALHVRTAMDLDGDGKIDNMDVAALTNLLGTGTSTGDLNGDGEVAEQDLAILIENLGRPLVELVPSAMQPADPDSEVARLTSPTGSAGSESAKAGGGRAETDAGGPATASPQGGVAGRLPAGGGAGLLKIDAIDVVPNGQGGSPAPRVTSITPPPEEWIVDGQGIDEFRVTFDRGVTVPQGSVALWASNASAYTPVTTSYDAFSRTLTVAPGELLGDDRYTLVVDYRVQSTDGLPLDGEVAVPRAPSFPSGDGSPGGEAVFQYTLLRGDATRDGVVDEVDRQLVLDSLGLQQGDAGFDPAADLNGDSYVNVLDVAIVSGGFGNALPEVTTPRPRVTSRSPSRGEVYVATVLDTVVVNFEFPIKLCSIRPTALYAMHGDGSVQPAATAIPSGSNAAAIFGFDPPLPAGSGYELRLSNALADLSGQTLPLDGDERWTTSVEEPPPVLTTDSAVVLGRAFDITTGQPLQGAFVSHYIAEGYTETTPPLPGSVFTDANGAFELTTVPFEGMEEFLIRVTKPGHTESLRIVEIMAGRCERVADASLNPTRPAMPVKATAGATLTDQMGDETVELEIPRGALIEDSEISLTILQSADAIRDDLPQFVMPQGVFIDISGVFGDETLEPVVLKLPNTFNLPLGTEIRFGKISHETGEWSDLRTPLGGDEPDDPNEGIGVVVPDGQGGTCIRVEFTNFCTICTPYSCNPVAPGEATPKGPEEKGPPPCPEEPGNKCGNSVINTREGYLWEELQLPTFNELGGSWGLRLGYAHHAAAPSFTITADTSYQNNRPVERTVYRFQIEGNELYATYDRTASTAGPNGTYFWDGRNGIGELMPTGSYEYEIESVALTADQEIWLSDEFGGNPSFFTGQTFPGIVPVPAEPVRGRAIIVNQSQSAYGSGWAVMNESRLHFDPDGCIVLVFGNNDYRLFIPTEDDEDAFISPAGEFSTLVRRPNGTYERGFADGSSEVYGALGRLLRRTDRFGYVSTFAYENGRLVTAVSPAGNAVNLFYDGDGQLERAVDSAGRETLFEVDDTGHLVSMTNAVGSTRTFEYDADGRLVGQGGARGERTVYEYSNTRVVAAESYDTDGVSLLRRREFGPSVLAGELGAALDAGLGTVEFPIPATASRVDTYTDGRGQTTEYETDDRGNVTRITDPLGRVVRFEYDGRGLVTRRYRADNSWTEFQYDDSGLATRSVESANGAEIRFEYDGTTGLPSEVYDPVGGSTSFEYDKLGNLASVSTVGGSELRIAYEDARFPDRATRITSEDLRVTRIRYDARGNLDMITDPAGLAVAFHYSLTGNLERIVGPSGRTTAYEFNALNQILGITDDEGRSLSIGYGEQSCGCGTESITSMTLPDQTTMRWRRDGLDRILSFEDRGGRVRSFSYDAEGNQVTVSDRNGLLRQVNFDAAGQPVQLRFNSGSEVAATFIYDVLGNLVEASNEVSTVRDSYDSLSRLTRRVFLFALPAPDSGLGGIDPESRVPHLHEVEFGYDLANRLRSRSSATGSEQYVYNERGLLDRIEYTDLAGVVHVYAYSYDVHGQRVGADYPGGLTQTRRFNDQSQLTEITLSGADGFVHDSTLYEGYTQDGQLVSETRQIAEGAPFRWAYTYTDAGRLQAAELDPPFDLDVGTTEFGYDPDGRLRSIGSTVVAHDGEGNRIGETEVSGLSRSIEWDGLNRAVLVRDRTSGGETLAEVRYWYDALGNRIAKEVNGAATYFHRALGSIESSSHERGSGSSRLIGNATGEQPVAIGVGGTVQGLHSDRRRTVIARSTLVDGKLVVTSSAYTPSGRPLYPTAVRSALDTISFAGLTRDLESGYLFATSRMVDQRALAFVQEDRVGLEGGYNFYLYADADPINKIDPEGAWAWLVAGAALDLGIAYFTARAQGCRFGLGDAASTVFGSVVGGGVGGLVGRRLLRGGTGFLRGLAGDIGASTAGGAAGGVAGGIADQFSDCPPPPSDIFAKGLTGGAAGFAGGLLSGLGTSSARGMREGLIPGDPPGDNFFEGTSTFIGSFTGGLPAAASGGCGCN